MRRTFASELYKQMKKNKNIWLLTGDVGFGVLDKIMKDFPKRAINCGVAEQNMIGIAVGLAHSGKIPVVYSITSFLLYRPFEFIRNDIDYDRANVKLVGSGRKDDYKFLGHTHICMDDDYLMTLFNISCNWPNDKDEIKTFVDWMIRHKGPCYLNLKR